MPLRDRALEWLKADWVLTVMGVLAAGALFATFAIVLIFGPSIRSTTASLDRSSEVTGCRSAYNALVVDARSELDILSSKLRRQNTRTDNAQIAVTVDAVLKDGHNIDALLAELNEAGAAELQEAEKVAAVEQEYKAQNDAYQAAVTLSRTDPSAFIAKCRRDNP